MKKRAITFLFVIFLILSVSLICVQAAGNDTKVQKAYSCLEDRVKDKCSSLSIEEMAFTVLAIEDCKSELEESSNDGKCWPDSGCDLKDTALSVMALKKSSTDTDDAEDWLLNQTESPKDLIWFLEIDSDVEANCQISYSGKEYDLVVKEDKKISNSAGSCLSVDQGGYWLKIDNDCYDVNFTISCDQEFLTTLLYMKKTGSTVYVSSKTNFGASEGKTQEKVSALCFGDGCNYEGSLWATLALSGTGHDISSYLPYLIAMADENEKYFPSSFLYILTEYDDFFSQIIDLQTNDYWKITDSPYHQFYDTSLALLALKGLSAEQATSAKDYLLGVQDEDGCWRTVRDTAFILYAAWAGEWNGGGGGSTVYCEDYEYFCVSVTQCDVENKLDYVCESSLGKVCCKEDYKEPTCTEKGGTICEGDKVCLSPNKLVPSSDSTKCCSGTCEIPVPVKPDCEVKNSSYHCRDSCYSTEINITSSSYSCNSGDVCCGPAPPKKAGYWWIYLLIILIVLVALGIIFRDRIRVFIFNLKNRGKGKSGPVSQNGPGRFPPGPPTAMGPRSRMILPGSQAPPQPSMQSRPMPRMQAPARKPAARTDKELDETLRKLKEMSK